MTTEPRQLDSNVPPGLAADLRRMYRPKVATGLDEPVLALAHHRAAIAASRRASVRRLTRWGLVAAAGLAVGVSLTVRLAWPGRTAPAVALAEDVNGDGVVDILDALVLERAIEAKGGRDINGDGVVNKADVDRVAMAAVRLAPKVGGNG